MQARFPFSAIVGQDTLKLALQTVAVDPGIGGVLILGDRGTGKSTAVRALASLLPRVRVVKGCPYRCDPDSVARACALCEGGESPPGRLEPVNVVDLPLGSTEDRLVGALDLERALAHGEKVFQPGLLAGAHRGFLYIDEVNLLEDNLVDLLLDVAATGENLVEREGLSVRHPARFVLVGSGNPEEGELRPQLLDRFGLAVDITTPTDIDERIEVVRRRDAFERDRAGFVETWKKRDAAIRRRITAAQRRLDDVEVGDDILRLAARLCMTVGTDGLRGELTLVRVARAAAALRGKKTVTPALLREVAPMSLGHRLRRNPLDDSSSSARVDRALADVFDDHAADS